MFNDMFNSNSWEQAAIGAKKADFRQNTYGFTAGGPVVVPGYDGHNKTFFFVENEYFRRNEAGRVNLNSVPNGS